MKPPLLRQLALVLCAAVLAPAQDREVVVYVSMDQEHSQRILERFEERTGISVSADYDTEDNKTVGMVGKLLASRDAPKADVYWNNEVGQSVRLKNEGLLRPYESPNAAGVPDRFKDPEGYWTGFAARARVLIYNTELIEKKDLPKRLEDLADPRFKGKSVMAKPLTGTTLTHVAALYAVWGDERTDAFLEALKENDVRWERGNAQSMRAVSLGRYPFGLTDTDDAYVALQRGHPVSTIFLDQGEGGLGTLVIPNTVMAIDGGPNPEEAEELIDFLLSPEVERMLAEGSSAQIPVHPGVPTPDHVVPLEGIRPMEVDFDRLGGLIAEKLGKLDGMFTQTDAGEGSGVGLVYAVAVLALLAVIVIAMRLRAGRRSAG